MCFYVTYPSLTLVPVGDKDDTVQSNPVGCHKNTFLEINISDQFRNQTWDCPLLAHPSEPPEKLFFNLIFRWLRGVSTCSEVGSPKFDS